MVYNHPNAAPNCAVLRRTTPPPKNQQKENSRNTEPNTNERDYDETYLFCCRIFPLNNSEKTPPFFTLATHTPYPRFFLQRWPYCLIVCIYDGMYVS